MDSYTDDVSLYQKPNQEQYEPSPEKTGLAISTSKEESTRKSDFKIKDSYLPTANQRGLDRFIDYLYWTGTSPLAIIEAKALLQKPGHREDTSQELCPDIENRYCANPLFLTNGEYCLHRRVRVKERLWTHSPGGPKREEDLPEPEGSCFG